MNNITPKNWTHCYYKSSELKAFISFGADPSDSPERPHWLYFVTLTDGDHVEMFQQECPHLDEALSIINQRYGHWELVDGENKGDGDGCESCEAH